MLTSGCSCYRCECDILIQIISNVFACMAACTYTRFACILRLKSAILQMLDVTLFLMNVTATCSRCLYAAEKWEIKLVSCIRRLRVLDKSRTSACCQIIFGNSLLIKKKNIEIKSILLNTFVAGDISSYMAYISL